MGGRVTLRSWARPVGLKYELIETEGDEGHGPSSEKMSVATEKSIHDKYSHICLREEKTRRLKPLAHGKTSISFSHSG